MINTNKQLDFFDSLYKNERDNEERNTNLIRIIKNFKYLRAHLESKSSYLEMYGEEYKDTAFAASKVGYVLYYLAILGYTLDRSTPKEQWIGYTFDKGVLSTSETRSRQEMYDMFKSSESLLKGFKMRYLPELKSGRLSMNTLNYAFDSLKELGKCLR